MEKVFHINGMAGKKKHTVIINRLLKLAAVLIILTIVLLPFYLSFIYSIKLPSEITINRFAWPENPTLQNYHDVIFENAQFLTGYKNSILTTIPTVFILMITTSMASYAIARNNGKFYRFIYTVFTLGILIPFQCLMLPLYLNLSKMGLTSNVIGYILARGGMLVSISILVVTGFVRTVPRELEEAAEIDGCNKFQTFWKIVFPLMRPVNATQLVLNTLFVWNDYTVALVIFRKKETMTLPLAQIVYFNENTSQLNLAFAFFILAMLPILILYFAMQKQIIRGIMSGAVKG